MINVVTQGNLGKAINKAARKKSNIINFITIQ